MCATCSQEVLRGGFLSGLGDTTGLLRSSLKDLVELREVLVEFENGSNVATTVAVVRGRPDCYECIVEHLLVTFHDELVRSADQINRVLSVKLLDDLSAEQIASATWADHPTWDVIRIAPHEIAHGAIMRHLLLPIDSSDLVQSRYRWTETTMDAEDLVIDDSCE